MNPLALIAMLASLTACVAHVPQPAHRTSERPAIPSPQLPEASPDGPVSSSGGRE